MPVVKLSDKEEILRYLQSNRGLHLYSIGDLDDFFFPNTTWWGLKVEDEISSLIMLYTGLRLPTVIALSDDLCSLSILLEQILPELPQSFYAHFSPGLKSMVENFFRLEPHGEHHKMLLMTTDKITHEDNPSIVKLTQVHLEDLATLFQQSYPGNWFDRRMLLTGKYFGWYESDKLVGVAGVHVYSKKYRVAALGNITTHPGFRGRGLGKKLTNHCCRELLSEGIETIGLNVNTTNLPAIKIYKKLGFEIAADYLEYMIETKLK